MIYNVKRPTPKDLSDDFAEFLQNDTVAHLKEAFSLMGVVLSVSPVRSKWPTV